MRALQKPTRGPLPISELRRRTFVVGLGTMKSGTTWLSGYLGDNPQFLHSPIKEMNSFNQFYDNPFKGQGDRFRMFRMESIILDKRSGALMRHQHRLRALAQLGRIKSIDDYLAYFAERIGDETHFGEISPSYSHLPPEGLREIAGITADVRFLLIMRDPAKRAASHIRHLRRRVAADVPVADLIRTIAPDHPVYLRSNYGQTLDALEQAGVRDKAYLLTFETLFRADTMRNLCAWLGLEFQAPHVDRKKNEGTGEELTPEQLNEIRERLDPIYIDLRARGFQSDVPQWWWDAPSASAG